MCPTWVPMLVSTLHPGLAQSPSVPLYFGPSFSPLLGDLKPSTCAFSLVWLSQHQGPRPHLLTHPWSPNPSPHGQPCLLTNHASDYIDFCLKETKGNKTLKTEAKRDHFLSVICDYFSHLSPPSHFFGQHHFLLLFSFPGLL